MLERLLLPARRGPLPPGPHVGAVLVVVDMRRICSMLIISPQDRYASPPSSEAACQACYIQYVRAMSPSRRYWGTSGTRRTLALKLGQIRHVMAFSNFSVPRRSIYGGKSCQWQIVIRGPSPQKPPQRRPDACSHASAPCGDASQGRAGSGGMRRVDQDTVALVAVAYCAAWAAGRHEYGDDGVIHARCLLQRPHPSRNAPDNNAIDGRGAGRLGGLAGVRTQ